MELPAATIRRGPIFRPRRSKIPRVAGRRHPHAAADLLVVRAKTGVDFMEGVIGDVTPERVEFKIEDETVPAQRAKIDGLIFFHKTAEDFPMRPAPSTIPAAVN